MAAICHMHTPHSRLGPARLCTQDRDASWALGAASPGPHPRSRATSSGGWLAGSARRECLVEHAWPAPLPSREAGADQVALAVPASSRQPGGFRHLVFARLGMAEPGPPTWPANNGPPKNGAGGRAALACMQLSSCDVPLLCAMCGMALVWSKPIVRPMPDNRDMFQRTPALASPPRMPGRRPLVSRRIACHCRVGTESQRELGCPSASRLAFATPQNMWMPRLTVVCVHGRDRRDADAVALASRISDRTALRTS